MRYCVPMTTHTLPTTPDPDGVFYCLLCQKAVKPFTGDNDCADAAAAQAEDEQSHWEQDPEYWAMYSPVEQGFYDDDPNPYAGDYSEM